MNDEVRALAQSASVADATIDPRTLQVLRPHMEEFFDPEWLESELNVYERWGRAESDPVLQMRLHRPLGSNLLVAAIWAAREWEREYREDAAFHPPPGALRCLHIALDFAVMEFHAGSRLNSEARDYLRKRLQAADEVWGVIHEVHTYGGFIRSGIDVEPDFLDKAAQYDLETEWKGTKLPVQCKSKRPGAGRLISQAAFETLAYGIAKDLLKAGRWAVVRIGSTAQPLTPVDVDFLREQVKGVISTSAGRRIHRADPMFEREPNFFGEA